MRFRQLKNSVMLALAAATLMISAQSATGCSVTAPTNTAEVPNQQIQKNDTLTALRFERYENGKSEVYFIERTKYSTAFYIRNYGSNEGLNTSVEAEDILPFDMAARKLQLGKYPKVALDDENKSRDRWMVELKFSNGKKISTVQYFDKAADIKRDRKVCETLAQLFKDVKLVDENGAMRYEHTITTYKADGKPLRSIRYTAEGVVCGGTDYDHPGMTF